MRAEKLADLRILIKPTANCDDDAGVQGQCKPRRDQRPPKDGDCEQPRRLTLAPIEISQDEHGNGRKQRREEEPNQEYSHRLGVK